MEQTITYPQAKTSTVRFGDRVEGFLALPDRGSPPFRAVILCPERYGLVQYIRDFAAKFAAYGYVCLAPDMFSRWDGDKEALARGDIMAFVADADIRSYLGDALDFLLAHPEVDPACIVGVGICLSGEYPLILNTVRKELAASIMLYGGAQMHGGVQAQLWDLDEYRRERYDSIIERITAPVLGLWGETDFLIPLDEILRVRNVFEAKRKSYEFRIFANMPHGWMNSSMPGRFRPRESDRGWSLMMDFIDRVRAGAFPPDRVRWRFESDIAIDYDFSKNVRV